MNCQLYDKLKQTLFNCLNERKPILNTFTYKDSVIDSSNINGLALLIKSNPLKSLHLQNFLKEKPKMLPIEELLASLIDKPQLVKITIADPLIRLGQVINNSAAKFFHSKTYLQRL